MHYFAHFLFYFLVSMVEVVHKRHTSPYPQTYPCYVGQRPHVNPINVGHVKVNNPKLLTLDLNDRISNYIPHFTLP